MSTVADFEAIAMSQAVTMARQAERIRELIREREAAKSTAEAAYDMAEQYARKSGHDIARDDVLRYVEDYWQARGNFERRCTELETFHWDILGLLRDLEAGIVDGRAMATPGRELAERVAARIKAVNQPGGRRKAADLFSRPAVPQQSLLFGEAA